MKYFSVAPPTPAENRNGIALVAIVKDEADYIAEWLEFHRAAGVRHFFIYDNGSRDNTLDVIRTSPHAEATTIIPWRMQGSDPLTGRRLSQQISAYSHAVTTFGMNFERMAFIDVDEFLVPEPGNSIMQAIEFAKNASNICLPWHMFGHSGHMHKPDGWVVKNFTMRAPVPYSENSNLLRYKCIVDPCRVSGVSVHHFETIDLKKGSANIVGRLSKSQKPQAIEFFVSSPLQLNHYYLRSRAELENKLSRGPVNYSANQDYRKRVLRRAADIEANPVEDLKAIAYCERHCS